MADQWMLRGVEFTNCNCDYGCPCQFNAPTTHGFCEALASSVIEEGYFNDTELDGLKFLFLAQWPGEIAEGNGRTQVIIDDSADADQREALRKIAHGESTTLGATHFSVFSTTMSEVLETLYTPLDIQIDVDAREASVSAPGLVRSSGTPCIDPHSGEPTRSGIHLPNGFEYTYAEMASGTSRVTAGIELDLKDSYGQFNLLHMNQDGVIRH